MDATELCYLSAQELLSRYQRRALSPLEVVDAVLARIERIDPQLGAFCTVTAEDARQAARRSEDRFARGEAVGPLEGVPVSIKDLTFTKGVRTTRGSLLYRDFVPDFDAPVVERLKAAGAVILGKTNTPEFGWKGASDNRIFPPTRNPWNLELTAGGSSGGAAAAVAAGLAPLAQGSDGAGSIRIPASLCGIYGIKPSFGLVPQVPPSPAESLSHIGPMTRTVRDAALMLDVIARPDDRDRSSIPRTADSYLRALDRGIGGLRVAWSVDLGFAPVEREVQEIAEAAARKLSAVGCEVETINPGFADPWSFMKIIYYAAQGGGLLGRYDQVRDQLDPGLAALIDEGRSFTAYQLAAAGLQRSNFWEQVRQLMTRYDFLLTPTLCTTAFPINRPWPETIAGQPNRHLVNWALTYPFNLTGQPAATVPAGFTRAGLPVGLQIVGRRWDDVTVLRVSAAFEQLMPWDQARPALAAS